VVVQGLLVLSRSDRVCHYYASLLHSPSFPQLSAWWFLTFTASEIKDQVQYLSGVQYLYDTINPDQIEVPEFVFQYDTEVNGTNYYTPATRGEDGTGGL